MANYKKEKKGEGGGDILNGYFYFSNKYSLTFIYKLGLNYQRLEFLGDSALKYLLSKHLFLTNPTHHEGMLIAYQPSFRFTIFIYIGVSKSPAVKKYLHSPAKPGKLPLRFLGQSWPARKKTHMRRSTETGLIF